MAALGARSFSIFNADTKQIVYDSGDQFERYIAANHPLLFNVDNESNTVKSRSRAKGPEPEGVALGSINGQTYAFITLERTGGVMVYNITDPNHPTFTDYKHSRSTSAYGGDNGPEGIIYIAPENTTTNKAMSLSPMRSAEHLSMYEVAMPATWELLKQNLKQPPSMYSRILSIKEIPFISTENRIMNYMTCPES
jgi:hypothetical protein